MPTSARPTTTASRQRSTKASRQRWVASQITALRAQLEAIATPERAEQERAYLHSELEHLGVSQPGIRKIAGDYHRANKHEFHDEQLRGVIDGLWQTSVHEQRSLAIALAERWRKSLGPDDLDMFERWLRDSNTWAHVDWLAVKVVGSIVAGARKDKAVGRRLDRWSRDPDMWVRRASMLALLDPMRDPAGAHDGGDFTRFERYAISMLDETEFFIRKAIGWILRDVGRKRPELTRAFVEAHVGRMAGLTLREAIKVLPPAEGERLRARHAALEPGAKLAPKK